MAEEKCGQSVAESCALHLRWGFSSWLLGNERLGLPAWGVVWCWLAIRRAGRAFSQSLLSHRRGTRCECWGHVPTTRSSLEFTRCTLNQPCAVLGPVSSYAPEVIGGAEAGEQRDLPCAARYLSFALTWAGAAVVLASRQLLLSNPDGEEFTGLIDMKLSRSI